MFELRPYQKQIIAQSREALINGFIAPIVVAPTGSGKTVIFAQIASNITKNKKRALILVHRQEIFEQTISKLYSMGITSGQIFAGRPMTFGNLITVGMISTVANRLGQIPKPDLLIFDECHHSMANQWKKIINHFYDVPRLGFTATPERLDGQGLGELWDIMIEGPTTAELVKNGYLCDPVVFSSDLAANKEYHMTRGDFDKAEQQKEMTKRIIVGDVIAYYKKFFNGAPCIVFCVSIKHCEIMYQAYKAAGWNPVIIHGKQSKTEREDAVSGLASGKYNQLISCEVVSEGFDVPVVAGVQMLRKTASLSLYLQQAGRALRLYEGKRKAIILDHVGNIFIHGHILDRRHWSLTQEKRNIKKETPPEITRCPKCFYVSPGKPEKCLVCGYHFEDEKKKIREIKIKNIAGDLREIMPDEIADDNEITSLSEFLERIQGYDKGKRNKAMLAMAYKLSDRDKIDALRKMIGYHHGWTAHAWRIINGRR